MLQPLIVNTTNRNISKTGRIDDVMWHLGDCRNEFVGMLKYGFEPFEQHVFQIV